MVEILTNEEDRGTEEHNFHQDEDLGLELETHEDKGTSTRVEHIIDHGDVNDPEDDIENFTVSTFTHDLKRTNVVDKDVKPNLRLEMRVDIDSGDCGNHDINDSVEQPDTHEVQVT